MAGPLLFKPADVGLVTFDWTDVLVDGVTLSAVTHYVPSPCTKGTEDTFAGQGKSQVQVSTVPHGFVGSVSARASLSNGETAEKDYPIRGFSSNVPS